MDLTLLGTLKAKLVEADQFAKVWEFFLDHFGEKEEFIALGERLRRHAFLEAVFGQIGRQLFRCEEVLLENILLTHLPEHRFVHGGCTINGHLANVLYFEDLQMGVMSVVVSVSPSDMRMIRFTGKPVPLDRGSPSVN
jgi:hypothetical protein